VDVLAQLPEGGIFVQDEAGLRKLTRAVETQGATREWSWSSQGGPRPDHAAGISRCEALVAMTGSLLFSARCGGRAVSVLPPCHIVIAQRSQLAADVEEALQRLQQEGVADDLSYVGLVTGPSRTADIERIVVMGAHGPMRLIVIVEE
jgi:L-lactate dehydrogenase complex protein LldG